MMDDQSASNLTALLDPSLGELAREIAMGIQDIPEILKQHGRSPAEFRRLCQDETFKRLLDSAVREWNSALSTGDRIRVKSQAMVEASLEQLHAANVSDKVPLAARIEGMKFAARLGGLLSERGEAQGTKGGAGAGFQITINIGDGKESLRITQPATLEGVAE